MTSTRTPARYTVAGITDERDACDCCGKSGLKRVVVLLDLDSSEFVFFGTTCASRNTGDQDIAKTARQRGKPGSPAMVRIEHLDRQAVANNKRALSILKMANGCADALTRAEADKYFARAAALRQEADAARRAFAA